MQKLKIGDLCKHFKGNNLIEKNIYEIVALNVVYTGTECKDLHELVIYKSLFQEDRFFAREYSDFICELNDEEKGLFSQSHRVELLTNEEKKIIATPEFIAKKVEYMNSKSQTKSK